LSISTLFSTFRRRLLVATVIWILFWPIFWFIRIGDITGAKSWFWIIGELNYPIAAFSYYIVDEMVEQAIKIGWKIFLLSAVLVAAAMPFFYKWFGFKMAVLLEAVVTGYLT